MVMCDLLLRPRFVAIFGHFCHNSCVLSLQARDKHLRFSIWIGTEVWNPEDCWDVELKAPRLS